MLTLTRTANLESPVNLISLDCGRKLDYPHMHKKNMKIPYKRPSQSKEPLLAVRHHCKSSFYFLIFIVLYFFFFIELTSPVPAHFIDFVHFITKAVNDLKLN